MIRLKTTSPPPTTGGMYLFVDPHGRLREHDNERAVEPVWVFEHHGELLFTPFGCGQGLPIDRYPRFKQHGWSDRICSRQLKKPIPSSIVVVGMNKFRVTGNRVELIVDVDYQMEAAMSARAGNSTSWHVRVALDLAEAIRRYQHSP